MSIRSTSYYGWNNIYMYGPNGSNGLLSASFFDIATDSSGTIYAVGRELNTNFTSSFIVHKSTDDGLNWKSVYSSSSVDKATLIKAYCIGIDSNDIIYVGGSSAANGNSLGGTIKKTIDRGTTWTTVSGGIIPIQSLAIDSNNVVYTGESGEDTDSTSIACASSSDQGVTWKNGFTLSTAVNNNPGRCVTRVDKPNNKIYIPVGEDAKLRYSTDSGASWTAGNVFTGIGGGVLYCYGMTFDSSGKVVVVGGGSQAKFFTSSDGGVNGGLSASEGGNTYQWRDVARDSKNNIYVTGYYSNNILYTRRTQLSQAFVTVDLLPSASFVQRIYIDSKDNIYIVGQLENKYAFVRRGRLSANSSSIGSRMLATSFGWVQNEISGVLYEQFALNNISEYPHSAGIFQMPNMIFGTKTLGRAGKTDDAIVQKRFVGSFVRVMYPKQEDTGIQGYDIGRKPGKLSTEWSFGDVINVSGKNFDHLALNCSVLKQISGTLDSILIRVETKPINDSGFSIDQTTELTISSSYSSETIYRDELHRKDINFGDLSDSEISWKIPIDLKNVKEIRIAAKQKNGQNDEKNKLLLVLGRFITVSKDHNET